MSNEVSETFAYIGSRQQGEKRRLDARKAIAASLRALASETAGGEPQ